MPATPLGSRFIPSPPVGSTVGTSASGASTAIAVTFPDGQTVVISATQAVYADPASPGSKKVTVGQFSATTPFYVYTATDYKEALRIVKAINDAILQGLTSVGIPAYSAATPAAANIGTLQPATGTVMGGTQVLVSLAAAALPTNGTAPGFTFTPDCTVLLGGRKCQTQFISAFLLSIVTPPGTVTAAVDLMYQDKSGVFQVTGAFTYT